MTDVALPDTLDADQIAADNREFVAQMQAILSGKKEPPSDTVGYLLAQYKTDMAAFKEAETALTTAQETLVKLGGRIEAREKDLRHLYDAGKAG